MTLPIALQTYTLREALAQDFTSVMRRVAEIGYVAVEPTFTIPGTTLDAAARLFQDLGLAVPCAHVPLPLGDDQQAVLDYMATFDCRHIVAMKGPDFFTTSDQIKRTCDLFNQAQAVAARHGLALSYHNHWWEFLEVEGRPAYHIMLEHLDPAIGFEIDTYWVQTADVDPAQVIRELGSRVPLLHIKDGPAQRDVPQVALGEGVLDLPGIIAAADAAQWLIVELDHCATDMLEAVDKSYRYLVEEGLGHGRQG